MNQCHADNQPRLIHRAHYLLPDGTEIEAHVRLGRTTREWAFFSATGEPLYVLDRDGRSLRRYVYDAAYKGYTVAMLDLQLGDLRRIDSQANER